MSKVVMFSLMLYKEVQKDDLISAANDLTYKILLALFPFIIFLLSLVSYLELDANYLLSSLEGGLPREVMNIISPFFVEVLEVKRPSIVSSSLIFTIFSASGGFNSVMKGINKAYGQKDERNFLIKRLISVVLVFIFALSIIVSMVMLIFNEKIYDLVFAYFGNIRFFQNLFSLLGYIITIFILLLSVIIINRISLARKYNIRDLLPGSIFTVVCWVVFSKAYNIYINNFSRYSAVYGSVASILILMIWLNLMCIVLLIGTEINAMTKVE